MEQKIPLVVVAGPTASGKTAAGVFLAQQLNGEVVSADSMQIYRHLTVGTAKPTPQEMQGIPHHLIDFLEPGQSFSVAEYVQLARQAIQEIVQRGKLPVLVGGTGLYISSLVDNIQFSESQGDPKAARAASPIRAGKRPAGAVGSAAGGGQSGRAEDSPQQYRQGCAGAGGLSDDRQDHLGAPGAVPAAAIALPAVHDGAELPRPAKAL